MPKRPLRSQLLRMRQALAPEDRDRYSLIIQQRLLALGVYDASAVLALYAPIHNEVRTDAVAVHARRQGKRLVYPRVEGPGLVFHDVDDEASLRNGSFGVGEPQLSRPVAAESIDLVLVPGVAFDRDGYRLGYGKGYYDRLWGGGRRALLAGLAYSFQVVESLPKEDHDLRLDLLVTETELLLFNNNNAPPLCGLPFESKGGPRL